MGAREDLLAAAGRLTRAGRAPFAPIDLIEEARRGGSNYPEGTLRTFIVGPMCLNSPDNHAVQYGDLFRVGRGLYRLAAPGDSSVTPTARPQLRQAAIDAELPHDAWSWEGNVQAVVVRHLASEGWQIRRVADTASREHGVDVEAHREGERLLVEVKGYPSTTYSRGERTGERRLTSLPPQARAHFSNALLSGLLMRSDHADARVALAFPTMATYTTLARRVRDVLSQVTVELWLVSESGEVAELDS